MINPFKNKKGLGRGLSSLIGDSDIKKSNDIFFIYGLIFKLTLPAGFEPAAHCLEGSCSIQLS